MGRRFFENHAAYRTPHSIIHHEREYCNANIVILTLMMYDAVTEKLLYCLRRIAACRIAYCPIAALSQSNAAMPIAALLHHRLIHRPV